MAFDGSSVDGSAYLDVVRLARDAPGWLDGAASFSSTYGLAVFALLAVVGWWFARRVGDAAAVRALAVPVVVIVAYGVDALVKPAVREDRPCRSLRVKTLETCPAPGDWSFMRWPRWLPASFIAATTPTAEDPTEDHAPENPGRRGRSRPA